MLRSVTAGEFPATLSWRFQIFSNMLGRLFLRPICPLLLNSSRWSRWPNFSHRWLSPAPSCDSDLLAEMKRFTAKIVDMMKQEKLYASQGGPIILSQIENEYGNVAAPYGFADKSYIKWSAGMAVFGYRGALGHVPASRCSRSHFSDFRDDTKDKGDAWRVCIDERFTWRACTLKLTIANIILLL